jgi:hypothetical protein
MKTLITFSALIALLAVGSVGFAGPAPGQPGLGSRVSELARSRTGEDSGTQPYALTGEPDRGPRSACDTEADLSRSQQRRCDPGTSVSHRRYPGGEH